MYYLACINYLTPWNRVSLGKLIVTQLIKKFPDFNGTWRFMTVFIRVFHWSLSWARSIHSPRRIYPRLIPILSSHLRPGPPSVFFPLAFWSRFRKNSSTSPLNTTFLAHLTPLDLVTKLRSWIVQVMKLLIMQFVQPPAIYSLLGSYLSQHPVPNILNLC